MDFDFLCGAPLFSGATADEARAMLGCLGSCRREYEREAVILRAGDNVDSMGLVLYGSVNIEIDDVWGNRSILDHVEAGGLFAETYACIPDEPLMVSAVAAERCGVLFLNAARLLTTCRSSCPHHGRLIRNLLQISARKNLILSRRSIHTSPKSIRGRLLSYLSEQATRAGGSRFTIPFNRQQLADYLGVDRSALSGELGKMRDDGLLTFNRSCFTLKRPDNKYDTEG